MSDFRYLYWYHVEIAPPTFRPWRRGWRWSAGRAGSHLMPGQAKLAGLARTEVEATAAGRAAAERLRLDDEAKAASADAHRSSIKWLHTEV